METCGHGPNRKRSTKQQLASWESTVAMAAPATPRRSTKIKTGSSAMLSTAPSTTENIAILGKPWQMINWLMPVESSAKIVPAT